MKEFLFLAFIFLPLALLSAQKFILDIKEYTLKNGMKVLFLEDHSSPLVAVQFWFRVGSRNEYPGITGISHLLEHMMFKGTEKIGSEEFSKIIQRMGGYDNAFTSDDITAYHEVVPSASLEKVLELESDRLQNLVFREFNEEKNVVMEERRWRTENSPDGVFWEELLALSYIAHPYRIPTVGWMSDLEKITIEDVKEHYRTFYSPTNAVLILVGDFEKKSALELVKKYFEKIQPANKIREVRTEEPPHSGERRGIIKKEGFVKKIGITYHIPSAKHADIQALLLLSDILGGGRTSRLYKTLMYEKQLVSGIYSYADKKLDPGLFYIVAELHPQAEFSVVESLIYEEIERIKKNGIEDKELQRSINQLKSNFIYSQESVMSQAFLIGSFEILTGYKRINTYIEEMEKIKKEDIQRVANLYLTENSRSVLYLEPVPPKDKEEFFKKMMEGAQKELRMR